MSRRDHAWVDDPTSPRHRAAVEMAEAFDLPAGDRDVLIAAGGTMRCQMRALGIAAGDCWRALLQVAERVLLADRRSRALLVAARVALVAVLVAVILLAAGCSAPPSTDGLVPCPRPQCIVHVVHP